MLSEKNLRLILFAAVAGIHALLILFFAFNIKAAGQEAPESARVMKVTDLDELPPPPPEPPPPPPPPPSRPVRRETPQVTESIAETMIETDTPPPAAVPEFSGERAAAPVILPDEYLPAHKVSVTPNFDVGKIMADSERYYPRRARDRRIEGRVILELSVDETGIVRQIRVLKEDPPGWDFGKAAEEIFSGRQGSPAMQNGRPVKCLFRYPVTFRLK